MSEQQPVDPDGILERAVDGVVEGLRLVAPTCSQLAVIRRGEHPLWLALRHRLSIQGVDVDEFRLAKRDRQWRLPEVTADGMLFDGQRTRADALLVHDPFGPAAPVAGACDVMRRLAVMGMPMIFLDFPHGVVDSALAARLESAYLTALGEPGVAIERRTALLRAILESASRVTLRTAPGGILVVMAPWTVHDDLSVLRHAMILQLPLGECWVVDPATVDGTFTYTERGRLRCLTAVAGRVEAPQSESAETLVEVGFGTNAAALPLAHTVLAEKSLGSAHLGFGDSWLLGGRVVAPFHSDLMLTHPRAGVVFQMADGRDVTLEGIFSGYDGPNVAA